MVGVVVRMGVITTMLRRIMIALKTLTSWNTTHLFIMAHLVTSRSCCRRTVMLLLYVMLLVMIRILLILLMVVRVRMMSRCRAWCACMEGRYRRARCRRR